MLISKTYVSEGCVLKCLEDEIIFSISRTVTFSDSRSEREEVIFDALQKKR